MYTLQPIRLAITTEGPTEAEAAIVARHWAYLQDLTARGTLIFRGRTLAWSEDCFAGVVFRADSEEKARNGYIPIRRISPLLKFCHKKQG